MSPLDSVETVITITSETSVLSNTFIALQPLDRQGRTKEAGQL